MESEAKFHWFKSATVRLGSKPADNIEINGEAEDNNLVMTGIGARVGGVDFGGGFTTLHLQFAAIQKDGTIGRREIFKYGAESNHELEVFKEVGPQEVIVGVGMRVNNDDLTTLRIYARPLDPETGRLGELRTYDAGSDPYHELEIDWQPDTNVETTILTGISANAQGNDITTLHLKTSQIETSLTQSKYKISGSQEVRTGKEPGHDMEVFYQTFSDHMVMVGMGFRVGKDDLSTMHLKFAPITAEGNISGDTIRVSRGSIPEHALETWYECPKGWLIVGCGMRVGNDDITTLHVHLRKLDPATGRLIEPRTERVGSDPSHALEVDMKPTENLESSLLRGIGVRVGNDDVTTMRLIYGTIEQR